MMTMFVEQPLAWPGSAIKTQPGLVDYQYISAGPVIHFSFLCKPEARTTVATAHRKSISLSRLVCKYTFTNPEAIATHHLSILNSWWTLGSYGFFVGLSSDSAPTILPTPSC